MRADKNEAITAELFERLPGLYVHPSRTGEWLPELPAEIGLSLLKCERLIPRLSAVIAARYGLAALELRGGMDLSIAMLHHGALVQVSRLAGAIYHGRRIRMLLSKEAIGGLFASVGDWAHGYAVAHVELAPPAPGDTANTAPLAEDVIVQDGWLCFRAWLSKISAPAAQRVALKFPVSFETGTPPSEFEAYGPDIVRAAGKGVLEHAS